MLLCTPWLQPVVVFALCEYGGHPAR
jgi:hypothetical protein